MTQLTKHRNKDPLPAEIPAQRVSPRRAEGADAVLVMGKPSWTQGRPPGDGAVQTGASKHWETLSPSWETLSPSCPCSWEGGSAPGSAGSLLECPPVNNCLTSSQMGSRCFPIALHSLTQVAINFYAHSRAVGLTLPAAGGDPLCLVVSALSFLQRKTPKGSQASLKARSGGGSLGWGVAQQTQRVPGDVS